jgi:hypothetical protein
MTPLIHFVALSLLLGCQSGKDVGQDDTGTQSECAEAAHFPELSADPANSAYDDPSVEVICSDETIQVLSNGIPGYEFVPVTPNGLSSQDWDWEITRSPEVAAEMTDIPLLGTAGFTVNGIPIYGPNEAEFPDPYGDPVYNEVVDFCLGHTGGTSDYHYHALLIECILANTTVSDDEPSPVLGYSLDGFPIYGPRGCVDAECSEIVEFQSSWETTGDPTTYAWEASECTRETCDEASGSWLDKCNGRTGPDGSYGYHATSTFPYILGCYRGTASDDAGGGQPGGNGGDGPGGESPPDCDGVSEGLPCCGDDICGGPETAENCPANCP